MSRRHLHDVYRSEVTWQWSTSEYLVKLWGAGSQQIILHLPFWMVLNLAHGLWDATGAHAKAVQEVADAFK